MPESITSEDVSQGGEHAAPDISVIIVSWNVRDLLVKCLESLLSPPVRGHLELQVIVVDNASSDGSAEAARQFPAAEVLAAGRNLGYGRANNIGMAHASARYILILNPDTVPGAGSLEALADLLDRRADAGIASPRLLNSDGSFQEGAFRFPTLWQAFFDLFPLPRIIPGRVRRAVLKSRINGRYPTEVRAKEPFRIDHPLGACMLIRHEAFTGAGGFNPNLYMYSEEIDMALRYRSAGWECWQVPRARVVHLGGGSTAQVPDKMYLELWRSRLYIYRTHYSGTAYRLLTILLVVAQAFYVTASILRFVFRRAGRQELRATVRRAGSVLYLVRSGS